MKILKTAKYNKIAQRIFVGSCITGLENEYFREMVADDATMLAQLVENGKEINKDDFFRACNLEPEIVNQLNENFVNYKYYYNNDENVAWYYDIGADVEYFYI